MRLFVVLLLGLSCLVGCSGSDGDGRIYGAQQARFGESLAVLGWNFSVSNLRWSQDYVLVDVDASPADAKAPHAKTEDIRFGLYGALSHPMETNALGSCDDAVTKVRDITSPVKAVAAPERLTGTVCLGPLKDRSAVRGVYTYSPHERIAGTSAAYPVAFPVGLLPTNVNDTGLVVKSTGVTAWRADGLQIGKAQLGDPAAFTGNGYMLLNLETSAIGAQYRDDSARRGGPMMLLAAPTLPGRGLNPACAAYGASMLILPDASRDAVQVNGSLCTQGEINEALLYATVAIVGTHAAVWTTK
ncbi:hypothetical protein A5634_24540 [Mycobacterium asiaticum]|uniref:Uncharacterized protein n=1 Tax=Mycobacterium asiaticum TaxID=1790 RepID=A0A1A3NXN9_MYCAS|nr:hypothetical protein [Mycobacterium asiaticum]OBK26716.1 hypothetical protein A5634_24540 [Mycobacterium asiaticum]